MIHEDFNFPVSIEEFAAYMDGNLTSEETQRISSIIENDDIMQSVIDGMEQSEETLADYTQTDIQLPEDISGADFNIPRTDNHVFGGGGLFNPFSVAACAAVPLTFPFIAGELECKDKWSDDDDDDDSIIDELSFFDDEHPTDYSKDVKNGTSKNDDGYNCLPNKN